MIRKVVHEKSGLTHRLHIMQTTENVACTIFTVCIFLNNKGSLGSESVSKFMLMKFNFMLTNACMCEILIIFRGEHLHIQNEIPGTKF